MVTGASLATGVIALKDTTRLHLYVNGPWYTVPTNQPWSRSFNHHHHYSDQVQFPLVGAGVGDPETTATCLICPCTDTQVVSSTELISILCISGISRRHGRILQFQSAYMQENGPWDCLGLVSMLSGFLRLLVIQEMSSHCKYPSPLGSVTRMDSTCLFNALQFLYVSGIDSLLPQLQVTTSLAFTSGKGVGDFESGLEDYSNGGSRDEPLLYRLCHRSSCLRKDLSP